MAFSFIKIIQNYLEINREMSRQQTLDRWLVRNYNPWANVRDQLSPNNNHAILCRLLFSSNDILYLKRTIGILKLHFHRMWRDIESQWENTPVKQMVPFLFQQNQRGKWIWNPRAHILADHVTLSYLCIKIFHKCFYCGRVIVCMGHRRKNGLDIKKRTCQVLQVTSNCTPTSLAQSI